MKSELELRLEWQYRDNSENRRVRLQTNITIGLRFVDLVRAPL